MKAKHTIPGRVIVLLMSGAVLISSLGFSGCTASKTAKGGAIGAASGGVIGGIIGNKKGNTAVGAIIGAAVGGTAGAVIGRYMDKQAKEIEEEVEGAKVERVGEGILITFDSGLLFEFGSYQLNAATRQNLDNFANTLQKYPDTEIRIEGHTDSIGSDEVNQKLSVQRASAVSDYIRRKGVAANRLVIQGYGKTQPIATNETEAGRRENRRVEVAIYANEALVNNAKSGKLK